MSESCKKIGIHDTFLAKMRFFDMYYLGSQINTYCAIQDSSKRGIFDSGLPRFREIGDVSN